MKIPDASELLAQVLPPKAHFIVEVAMQYDSKSKSTKIIAFVSIKIIHEDQECYFKCNRTENLESSVSGAILEFKNWYGKTCGFCWGTKRNTTGDCLACTGENKTPEN